MTLNQEAFAKALAAGIAAYDAAVADNGDGGADCTDVGYEWIEWAGASPKRPVSPDTLVDVRFRNGDIFNAYTARFWSWKTIDVDSDIVAYRLSK